jgi:hypothetical protein
MRREEVRLVVVVAGIVVGLLSERRRSTTRAAATRTKTAPTSAGRRRWAASAIVGVFFLCAMASEVAQGAGKKSLRRARAPMGRPNVKSREKTETCEAPWPARALQERKRKKRGGRGK